MKKKILIIDDEKGIQEMMQYFLSNEGFEVDTADNGKEGVELVKKNKYDFIFLDVHMPVMRGPEALAEIKKIKPEQIVFICSSSSDPEFSFEMKAKEMGASFCFYKPVDINDILNIISEASKP